jgi:hypothetical protein
MSPSIWSDWSPEEFRQELCAMLNERHQFQLFASHCSSAPVLFYPLKNFRINIVSMQLTD